MEDLKKTLFEQAASAQIKYEIRRELYGLQSGTTTAALFRYETLHDVIEISGLMPEYLVYCRERRKAAKTASEADIDKAL